MCKGSRAFRSAPATLRRAFVSACLSSVCFVQPGFCEEGPGSPNLLQNPSNGGNLSQFISARTPFEFWLTCLIGAIGLAIIGVLMLAFRSVRNPRIEDISRPIIVVTVIMSTLMLVTVGYSNEQIAPAFGLFGTIVGYMLGRLAQPSPQPSAQPDQASDDAAVPAAATNQRERTK